MTIKDALLELETAGHPVARALHKGHDCQVLVLAFKAGMSLKEHKTPVPARLTVLSGAVTYREGSLQKALEQYDETDIPADILHAVDCTKDALCLLVRG